MRRLFGAIVLVLCMSLAMAGTASAAELPLDYPGVPIGPSPVIGSLDENDVTNPLSVLMADTYSLELNAGQRLKVTIEEPRPDVGWYLELNGPDPLLPRDAVAHDGESWWWVSGRPLQLTYIVPPGMSGTYFITLWDGGSDTGPYSLEYTVDEDAYTVTRVAGSDRFDTAVRLSQAAWPAGMAESVIIASGADFPDAICAAGLAGTANGPILLSPKDQLPESVIQEIQRLGISHAYVVGGEAALSDAVFDAVASIDGVKSQRIAGSDRYATSRAIAAEVGRLGARGPGFLVRGDEFADAVACSWAAARIGSPIYLTQPDYLDPLTRDMFAKPTIVIYIVGGPKAVSTAIEQDLHRRMNVQGEGGGPQRFYGANRYATAATLGAWAEMPYTVGVANGERFPDALVAGPYLARRKGFLLLTRQNDLPSETAFALRDATAPGVDAVIIGGPAAISPRVENQAGSALSAAHATP